MNKTPTSFHSNPWDDLTLTSKSYFFEIFINDNQCKEINILETIIIRESKTTNFYK